MALQWRNVGEARILDFDCEARPLHWIGGDYVSREITSIAWKFIGERGRVEVRLLGQCTAVEMLEDFRAAYDVADVVTGHYIRGFDLPNINGALIELGMSVLSDKLSQDTKLDLVKRSGLSSSQENIGAMLGLKHDKVKMNQSKWRDANRLTPEGIELTKTRVVGDVLQHIEMRARLLDLGYLGSPRMWRSSSGVMHAQYTG